jgi:uncharacterized protein YndB with AHSA1/START domain
MTAATIDIATPPDRPVILWSRVVKTTPEMAFEMWTDPEHVRNWLGPRYLEMPVCDIDLRVGGAYRFVHRAPDGSEHAFHGEYREVDRPHRLVSTWVYEGMPDDVSLETINFEPVEGGTRIHGTSEHVSVAARDQHLASGMERGMIESYERFDERVAALQEAGRPT